MPVHEIASSRDAAQPAPLAVAVGGDAAARVTRRRRPRQPPQPSAQRVEFFEANIRPVLVESCFDCHTDDEEGRAAARFARGAAQGRRVGARDRPRRSRREPADAGDPPRRRASPKMPKDGAEADRRADRGVRRSGSRDGAPWPAATSAAARRRRPRRAEKVDHRGAARVLVVSAACDAGESPEVARQRRGRRPTSIASSSRGSRKKGWRRCDAADKRTLIRRATLDLTGLPPTPEEIDAFEKDTSPDAFAKVVDRLLASPHYGETWGRTWLDVARYGEDDPRSLDPKGRGYAPYPNAYLYRDWVDQGVQRRPAVRPVRQGADRRRPDRRDDARAHAAGARASSASAPGTTTTARSRSRAPTSGTIAWTSSRAASSA